MMDHQEAAWEELAARIAVQELGSDDEVADALEPSGLLEDPRVLLRARALLDRFWGMLQQDPPRAHGQATLAAVVAKRLAGPPILQADLRLRKATALFALGRSKEATMVGAGVGALLAAIFGGQAENPEPTW